MNRVAVMLEHHELEALEHLGALGLEKGGEAATAEEVARYVLRAVITGAQTTGNWQACVVRALFPHRGPLSHERGAPRASALKAQLDCTSRK
jgi:hypothetical protein